MRYEVLVLFLLLGISFADDDINPVLRTVSGILGQAGNGTIFYQLDEFIQFGNILNPIKVSVTYGVGSVNYPAHICLNPFASDYTISGVHLDSTCAAGGLGYATNTSSVLLPNQKEDSIMTKSSDVYSTETTPASIYTKPNTYAAGAFVVIIPASNALQQFSLSAEWYECLKADEYPVGTVNTCVTIPTYDIPSNITNLTILSGGWSYFKLSTPNTYDSTTLNSFTVSFSQDDSLQFELYVQQGYYPTRDWYMNAEYAYDDDAELSSATVWTPTGTYFVGIYNSGTSSQAININISSSVCEDGLQGYNCQVDNSKVDTPFNSVYPLSATVDLTATSGNNGTTLSFESDEDFTGLAYFSLGNYPNFNGSDLYVRVSVANNDISDVNGAPGLFAKQGFLPSEQSNHLNVSTVGDVSHQILVPFVHKEVLGPLDTWYIAVKIPDSGDFSIWVGVNCANNCSNGDHGECYCGSETCVNVTNNGANLKPLYDLPLSILDSGGSCTCNDADYSQSYDCSEKNNGLVGVYLLLLGILVFLVIIISVVIPLGCMVYKKKNSRYHRETINYDTI